MSDIIEVLKAYITTPEGLAWFSETMNKANLHHAQKTHERRGVVTRHQLEQKWNQEARDRARMEEERAPVIHVSRQDADRALQNGDSFYVHEEQDETYHLKSIHMGPGSRFDARFIPHDRVNAILSGDVHMLRVSPGEPGLFRVSVTV